MSYNTHNNTTGTNQPGYQPTTMERVAAHIPGTTEHAERRHPNLVREGGRGGAGNMMTTQGMPTHDAYDRQAGHGLPATANETSRGAGVMPHHQHHNQQDFGAPTMTHDRAAAPMAGGAGYDNTYDHHANTMGTGPTHGNTLHRDPAAPSMGQKIAGKTKAGMGRLLDNPRMEAEGIQKAQGNAYGSTTTGAHPGAYPADNHRTF